MRSKTSTRFQHAHLDPRFFSEFAPHAFQQRLAHLEHSSGNRPLAFERRPAAANQQGATLRNHHSAHAD